MSKQQASKKPRYTYEIWKEDGRLRWIILCPDGSRYGHGSSTRPKRELEASLKKTCARLSGTLGRWRPTPIDQPAIP